MLFNSYSFILFFLPIALWGYFRLGKSRREWGPNLWLLLLSLVFYAWWNAAYLPLLLLSIGVNYYISGMMLREENPHARKFFLQLGLAFNLLLLCGYKYTDFLLDNLNIVLGTEIPLPHVILPLGISFFTITQTAYLMDCYRRLTREHHLLNYSLFVTFFPHLLAGPILHHKDTMCQFADSANKTVRWECIARGMLLFCIGLLKKVVIADALMAAVQEGFLHTEQLTFIDGWLLALSYTFQLYFDFSGYSDMAVGTAWMFNIKLPINFAAPYRARSMIEFWRRWHMTLSRFLKNYLYIPLGGNRRGERRKMYNLLLTMLIGGFWHGAGWTFVIWGGIHGVALMINHQWRRCGGHLPQPLDWLVTFVVVVIAWVFFRAATVGDAFQVIEAMLGMHGIILPGKLGEFLTQAHQGELVLHGKRIFVDCLLCMGILAFVPDSNELVARFRPSGKWLIGAAAIALLSLVLLNGDTEFLYFQF